jgi:outer membrane lipoprotein-sorting protein
MQQKNNQGNYKKTQEGKSMYKSNQRFTWKTIPNDPVPTTLSAM